MDYDTGGDMGSVGGRSMVRREQLLVLLRLPAAREAKTVTLQMTVVEYRATNRRHMLRVSRPKEAVPTTLAPNPSYAPSEEPSLSQQRTIEEHVAEGCPVALGVAGCGGKHAHVVVEGLRQDDVREVALHL